MARFGLCVGCATDTFAIVEPAAAARRLTIFRSCRRADFAGTSFPTEYGICSLGHSATIHLGIARKIPGTTERNTAGFYNTGSPLH
jgi:hypothetical protein